jgi:hypothetical protein
MNAKKGGTISRREFAQRAAVASAAAAIAPANILGGGVANVAPQTQQPSGMPKLSPESQAEVAARIAAILGQYGSRFSAEQKADIQRLCFLAQPSLDRLRAYNLENSDAPSLYLKPLVEREKKPVTRSAGGKLETPQNAAPKAAPKAEGKKS